VFWRGGSRWAQILGKWGRRLQSIYGPIDKRNDVATTLPLEVFTQRNFVADFFRQNRELGVMYVHGSFMAHSKARANWTFSPALRVWGAMSGYWSKLVFERKVGHFERNFQGIGVVHQRPLTSENYSHWAITWRGLHDPTLGILIQYRRVTDTHTPTHNDGWYLHIASAARVKWLNAGSCKQCQMIAPGFYFSGAQFTKKS